MYQPTRQSCFSDMETTVTGFNLVWAGGGPHTQRFPPGSNKNTRTSADVKRYVRSVHHKLLDNQQQQQIHPQ